MKQIKYVLALVAAIIITMGLTSCATEEDPQVNPVLSENSITLSVDGGTKVVTITGGVPPYILSNSNSQVVSASNASSNSSIVLTPRKAGNATITVAGDDGGQTGLLVTVR